MFGALKLTKNADTYKYKYSGYGTGFDRRGTFSFPIGRFVCNVIIFGVDMSSSVNGDKKKKDISILGEGPTQGLDGTTFVNGTKIIEFKAKDSEIVAVPLCLGNISGSFSADNMKKTGVNGHVYDFSVDYDAIAVVDILEIDMYLMKKNSTV